MQKTSPITAQKAKKIAANGARAYKKQKIRDGRKHAFQLLSSDWTDPSTYFQLGVAAHNGGDTETSIPLYEKSLGLKPADQKLAANILQALGSSYSNAKRFDDAIDCFNKSLEIVPDNSGALNNRALAYSNQRNVKQAIKDLQKAHALSLNNPGILLNLGTALVTDGKSDEALALYENNISLHSENADLHLEIGNLKKINEPLLALQHFRKAVALNPTNQNYLLAYAQVFELIANLQTFDGLEDDLLLLFSHKTIPWNKLNRIVPNHIKAQPAFKEVLPFITHAVKTGNELQLDFGKTLRALSNNVLISALTRIRLADAELEKILELFRRQSLAAILSGTKLDKSLFDLLRALLIPLTHYCFASEYVFSENEFEKKGINALTKQFEDNEPTSSENTILRFLILSCYVNCEKLPFAKNLQKDPVFKKDPELAKIIQLQITDPLSERSSYNSIPKITAINDSISLSVQEQYEENPYPRWHHIHDTETTTYSAHLARLLPSLKGIVPTLPEKPSVLIAGCGTGRQPLSTARAFPETDVLAVDLSLASISYAMRKTKELGVKNIKFGQADIMELGTLDQKFNIIECAGVLHHMNDPVAGWCVLCDLLDDDGFMIIGLYSEIGRQDVVATRQFIKENNYGNSVADIRRCRKELMTLDEGHPAFFISKHSDFYTTSACRDLIFHVQEHRFTIPQLSTVLSELGLEFMGFSLDRKQFLGEFDEMFPDDPFRINLDNWNKFEEKNPSLFATMYKFWVRKKR